MKITTYYQLWEDDGNVLKEIRVLDELTINPRYIRHLRRIFMKEFKDKYYWLDLEGFSNRHIINQKDYNKISRFLDKIFKSGA